MLMLFSFTLFVSAMLLFMLQPMVARMVLPQLGGTPAVWNTCMVFFQAALLAGYAWAHGSVSLLSPRRQILTHLGFILLPLLVLPIGLAGWEPPREGNPVPWLLWVLAASAGVPFLVASTTAPVLQTWFAATTHPAARDPYFLYAASNFGSMAGLIGYLVVVEPRLTLAQQGRAWSMGYLALLGLIILCGLGTLRSMRRSGMDLPAEIPPAQTPPPGDAPTLLRRLRWVALAFVPSSLMLGVTSSLTTDVASAPLLWVVPLALYLLTFMIAFARRRFVPHSIIVRAAPPLVLLQLVILAGGHSAGVWAMLLHLLTFFVVALACHGELANDRPSARRLTSYYLLLSVGGALGGAFNALIAPAIFASVLEYPLMLALACALPRRHPASPAPNRREVVLPAALALLVILMLCLFPRVSDKAMSMLLAMGILAFICFTFVERPLRLGLGLGLVAIVIPPMLLGAAAGGPLAQGRSFYGVYRIHRDATGQYMRLSHGTTLHGSQGLDPARRREPLAYFTRGGPIGQVFEAINASAPPRSVGVVGLGAGSLACYAEPGQRFVFYEIDPAIAAIASDTRYFSFLDDARRRGAQIQIVLGDARLTLRDEPRRHDLLILDAFSSDAIPIHLLTREALGVYLARLADGGLLALHISSRHLDLEPIVAALAADAGLVGRLGNDAKISAEQQDLGRKPSTWVVLARHETDLHALRSDPRWRPLHPRPGIEAWTDDFSNILQVMKWR